MISQKNMAFSLPKVVIDGLQADVEQWQTAPATAGPKAEDFGIVQTKADAANDLLPDIDIRDLDLRNIRVGYKDAGSAMDTKFDIKTLLAELHKIDLNKEVVEVGEVILDGADAQVLFAKIAKKKKHQHLAQAPPKHLLTGSSPQKNYWSIKPM